MPSEVTVDATTSTTRPRILCNPRGTRRQRQLGSAFPCRGSWEDSVPKKALLTRGGASWFPMGAREPYDEFPDDFDYDAPVPDDEGGREEQGEQVWRAEVDQAPSGEWQDGEDVYFRDADGNGEDLGPELEGERIQSNPSERSVVQGLGSRGASVR